MKIQRHTLCAMLFLCVRVLAAIFSIVSPVSDKNADVRVLKWVSLCVCLCACQVAVDAVFIHLSMSLLPCSPLLYLQVIKNTVVVCVCMCICVHPRACEVVDRSVFILVNGCLFCRRRLLYSGFLRSTCTRCSFVLLLMLLID